MQHVSDEHRKVSCGFDIFFPDLVPGMVSIGRSNRADCGEYAKLVFRQLCAVKIGIDDQCYASEIVFTVGKSNGNLQEAWSGRTLSQHARVLPKATLRSVPVCLVGVRVV